MCVFFFKARIKAGLCTMVVAKSIWQSVALRLNALVEGD